MTSSGTNPPAGSAGPAWELLLPAAAAPARQRGRTLRAALRAAVRSGTLAAGTRLPSTRDLARDIGVSRGLVTEAYEQLAAEGYLRSGRGAGTWVTGAARCPARVVRDLSPGAERSGIDFRPGTPDLALFPRSAWSAAYRGVLAEMPHQALGYPDPRGLPVLREALAELLARRRGVVADPERLVVCSGVAQAMTLLGSALRERGVREIGVEDPGSPQHALQFAVAGIDRTVPVPVDRDGLRLDRLAASGVRAVVTTPSHQFPLGIAYTARRRAGLLEWARTCEGLIVEDDYDGDFRYDRAPVGALQGLDPERVAYTGSVSKSLAPGLRLGWLLPPGQLVEAVVAHKRMTDLGNPAPEQAQLARFLARGDYDRHLRRCQRAYRERRDALVSALGTHFPGTSVDGIAAGLHVIARLPERYGPQREFLARAAGSGAVVRPLDDYGDAGPPDGTVRLVLGYAHLAPGRIAEGVRLLRGARGG